MGSSRGSVGRNSDTLEEGTGALDTLEEGTGALDMGLVGDAEVVVGGGRGRVAGSGGGKGFGSDGRILIGRRWEKC